MPRTRQRWSTTAWRSPSTPIGALPHRCCDVDHTAGPICVAALHNSRASSLPCAQGGDIGGLAVVAVLDPRRHRGIGRDQRDASARPRPHQRHPDMRPVAVPGCAVAGHRYETACVRPDFDTIGGTQHDLQHRADPLPPPSWSASPIPGGHCIASQPAVPQPLPRRRPAASPLPRRPRASADAPTAIAPAHSTIRSAVSVTGPSGPSGVDARPRCCRRNAAAAPRLLPASVRLGRLSAGIRIARPRAGAYTVDDVERDRAHARRQLGLRHR